MSIGSPDAESDSEYIADCFCETEDLVNLLDPKKATRIVLARTGAGKTALLRRVAYHSKKHIPLSPQDLSLSYLSDSKILGFFEEMGVNFNVFYLLLWRHILCVELIKKKYEISNEQKKKAFLEILRNKTKGDNAKKKAMDYIELWGDKFWETTESRIKEVTQKLEDDLKAKTTISLLPSNFSIQGKTTLSEEQRLEIAQQGRDVVNKIQIKELNDVIKLLAEDIFDDPQETYYVLIDALDEQWVEDRIRFKMIRALIDTVKKFQTITNVKIILSLRTDLLEKVITETRDAGFQEEKYESLYLRLKWDAELIERILDSRVNQLFIQKFNKRDIKIKDLLPKNQRERMDSLGYILSRTFLRPREAIIFFNYCLEEASGQAQITFQNIKNAEMRYSQKRLLSLRDEWSIDYPLLDKYIGILNHKEKSFRFSDLDSTKIDNILLEVAYAHEQTCQRDVICKFSKLYIDGQSTDRSKVLKEIIRAFYHVGIIGIKLSEQLPIQWSYLSELNVSVEQISSETNIHIHPTFYMALGIDPS